MIHVIGQKKLKLLPRQNVQGTCSNFVKPFFSKHHIIFKIVIISTKVCLLVIIKNEAVSITPCSGTRGSHENLGFKQKMRPS